MAFELTTFGPGATSGASVFFGPTQKLLQLSLALCDDLFFDMSSWSSCKTSQQLGHVQGLKRCLASRCSPTDNEAIFPGFDSVTAREAVPGRHLKTAWHLASFWGPAILNVLDVTKEQTLSSAVLCPVMYREVCGSWVATPQGQRATSILGCGGGGGGDVMADDKMWQLLLYLAARWRHRWASMEAHFCNAWQL